MQKLIYLASPFSHKDNQVEEYREFMTTAAAAQLTQEYGYAMFLPITQSYAMKLHSPELGGSFECWKDIDLYMVREKVDEIWVLTLPGWDKSIGVLAELEEAKNYNKPIKYLLSDELGGWYLSDKLGE